jgi:hypothetical protein
MKPYFLTFFSLVLASRMLLAQSNPVPLINQPLVPASAKPGSKGFTLTLNGTGFANGAVVEWNGSERITEFFSGSQLKATIKDSDLVKAGTAWVKVVNPNGSASSVAFFPIRQRSSAFTFTQKPVFPNCVGVAVGDFNNDGLLDVAWGSSNSLYVSLGDGKGGFQAPIPSSGGGTSVMIAADLNGDGNLDLAVDQGATIAIYMGDGHGNLTYKSLVSTYGGNSPLAIADFNQDGILDIYTAGWNTGQQYVEIYAGNGDGTFKLASSYYTSYFSEFPAVGDFNGDGWLDLVISELQANSMEFFSGRSGGFTDGGSIPYGAANPIAADMNRDGKLDILGYGCILLGKGDGTFAAGGCAQYSGTPVATADFDGDGLVDAAMSGYQGSSPALAIGLGAGDGTYKKSLEFPAGLNGGPGAVGDFNNDGWMDVITNDGFLMLQTTVSLSPVSLSFGNLDIGKTSQPQTATLSNVGKTSLAIKSIGIVGSNRKDFAQTNNCGTSLPSGESCQIQITFTPTKEGQRSASLNAAYRGVGSPQSVLLSGTGVAPPTVSLTPPKLSFPLQLIHTVSLPLLATLTNTGTQQPVTISSIATTGAFTQTNNCPSSLPVGNNCQISVEFEPTKRGPAHGTLSVTDDAQGSPQKVGLSGEGTVVVLSPQGINFGDQKVGTKSAPAPVKLVNKDKNPVSISSIAISGPDAGDFTETNNCGTSVAAYGHCTIKVTFNPTSKGKRSATLSVYDDGGGSPQTVALSGTGT